MLRSSPLQHHRRKAPAITRAVVSPNSLGLQLRTRQMEALHLCMLQSLPSPENTYTIARHGEHSFVVFAAHAFHNHTCCHCVLLADRTTMQNDLWCSVKPGSRILQSYSTQNGCSAHARQTSLVWRRLGTCRCRGRAGDWLNATPMSSTTCRESDGRK